MSSEEKAKQLIEKFSPLVTTWDCYFDSPRNEDEIIKDAKACALICVEEIFVILNYHKEVALEPERIYWQQVKEHLQKEDKV